MAGRCKKADSAYGKYRGRGVEHDEQRMMVVCVSSGGEEVQRWKKKGKENLRQVRAKWIQNDNISNKVVLVSP